MAEVGWTDLIGFWLLGFAGAWSQTLTGFALGLIVMSGTTLLGLLPLPITAQIISVLVLLNGALVLSRDHRHVDRQTLVCATAGAMPMIALGYWLLNRMADGALEWLRLLLGAFIAFAALQLMRRPQPRAARPPALAFAVAGASGGVMGGLFATSGPPMIWLLYRQPIGLDAIRVTLVSYFVATQMWRLALTMADQRMDRLTLLALAGALAATTMGTWVARRFPPPVPPLVIRRAALILLFLSGLALIAAAGMALAVDGGQPPFARCFRIHVRGDHDPLHPDRRAG